MSKLQSQLMATILGKTNNRIMLSCGMALAAIVCGSSCKRDTVNSTRTPLKKISGPVKYAALGDSTGAGVGATDGGYVLRLFRRIARLRPESKLTNLCISGATTADVLRVQVPSASLGNPNLITLGIGINDIGHLVGVDEFSRNYDAILQRLTTENPGAVVIVANIPDVSSAPRVPQALRTEYHRRIVSFNQKLEEIAARYAVIVFDVYTVTREQLPLRPEFFSSDGFHPSDQGYETWAEEMWPVVERAIGGAE